MRAYSGGCQVLGQLEYQTPVVTTAFQTETVHHQWNALWSSCLIIQSGRMDSRKVLHNVLVRMIFSEPVFKLGCTSKVIV
jgi:hypothetical protein